MVPLYFMVQQKPPLPDKVVGVDADITLRFMSRKTCIRFLFLF